MARRFSTATIPCLLLAMAAAPALAQDGVQFDLPPQQLAESLKALGVQTKLNVLVNPHLVDGLSAPPLKAQLTTQQALSQLLSGTELEYRFIDERTVVIQRKKSPGAAATSSLTSSEPARLRLAQEHRMEPSSSAASSAVGETTAREQFSVEEIIVTAQKRRERLIDTPQSVTVLSAEALDKLGATQLRDFADTVPGLSLTTGGAGFSQVSLRGVTVGFDIATTVAIYVDEVPYASSNSFNGGNQLSLDVGLFDVERIEILRGPQGTLYGASAMGGLIKYVTRSPDTSEFGIQAQSGVASTRHGDLSYNGAVALNAPLVTDKAALRVSGFYSHDGGYIDNLALAREDVNNSGIYGGRADLLLTPSDALSVRLTALQQNISRDGIAVADHTLAGQPRDGDLEQRRLFAEPFDQRFKLVSGTVTYDFGAASLTSVSSYQDVESELAFDSSSLVPVLESMPEFPPLNAVGQTEIDATDKFTQEIRLVSDADEGSRFDWVIGGLYTKETGSVLQQLLPIDALGQIVPIDVYTQSIPSRYEEYAAFGDLTWRFTDRFDVTGGLRYARNKQRFEQIASGLFASGTPERGSSDDVLTYLGNARYRFGDRSVGYLRYATGYRPGGPNFTSTNPITGQPIGPEVYRADRLKSYEAGYKAETSDRRYGVEVAGYYIDWTDIQILVFDVGFSGRANAPGGATIRGAELTLTARPVEELTLLGAFAYQDATMSEDDPDLNARKGESLPNVPRLTAALTADYTLPLQSVRSSIGATLRYVDERTASFDNATGFQQYQLPDYTSVDLRLGFRFGRVDTQFYLRNVFDERGQMSTRATGGIAPVAMLQPRTFGVNFKTDF